MRICKREGSFDRGIYYHLLVALSCRRCRSTRNVCAPRKAEHDILLVDSVLGNPTLQTHFTVRDEGRYAGEAMAVPRGLQWYLTK
jgi:hypothetical protein